MQIVMTKTDLVKPKDLARRTWLVQEELAKKFTKFEGQALLISSLTHTGIESLKQKIVDLADREKIQKKMDELSKFKKSYFI